MSFLGGGDKKKDPFEPGKTERENNQGGAGDGQDKDPRKPTPTRFAIWIIVGAVGLYFLGSGIYGILTQ